MSALRRPSALLIDLSGTIHIENEQVKGAIEAVKLMRRQNVPFLFVTNTSKVNDIIECHIKSHTKTSVNSTFLVLKNVL